MYVQPVEWHSSTFPATERCTTGSGTGPEQCCGSGSVIARLCSGPTAGAV